MSTSLALELHQLLERAAGYMREECPDIETAADLERWSEIAANLPVLGLERLLETASKLAESTSHFLCTKCTEYCGSCGVYWPVCQARRGEE